MLLFIIVVFGIIGLLTIFMFWDILMTGVATGNSSALAPTYPGFNEVINALPWLIPIIFVFMLALAWWFTHYRTGK